MNFVFHKSTELEILLSVAACDSHQKHLIKTCLRGTNTHETILKSLSFCKFWENEFI